MNDNTDSVQKATSGKSNSKASDGNKPGKKKKKSPPNGQVIGPVADLADSEVTAAKLTFSIVPVGKSTAAEVTAFWGDEFLDHSKFDVPKPAQQKTFVADLRKIRPDIDATTARRKLAEQSAAIAARRRSGPEPSAEPDAAELLAKMPAAVREEAAAMLKSPRLMRKILDDVAALGVAGERGLVETLELTGVSRLLPEPAGAIIMAPTSTGKSFTLEKLSHTFPPESRIHATSMTPQALFYMPPGSLRNRFVVGGERSRRDDDETAEATKALREMLSNGRLSKLVTMTIGGKLTTVRIEQEGPIAFAESTSQTHIFGEDANRCLLLSADERTAQTRAVITRQAAGYSCPTAVSLEVIIQRHHALHRTLKQLPVVVPFAGSVGEHFDVSRVEARRGFPHLIKMVQASALLYQFRRARDADGRIIATIHDYERACRVCQGPLARLLGGRISDAALRFYERMLEWPDGPFTTTEAFRRDGKTSQVIRDWLRELCGADAVIQVELPAGCRPAVWCRTAIDPRAVTCGRFTLPSVEIVFA